MDNQEEKEPVWDLLKEASSPTPSPFFARNVVREVKKLEDSVSWSDRLLDLFRTPLGISGALAAIAIVAVGSFALIPNATDPAPPIAGVDPVLPASSFDPASELEAVEYLGQLMAVADPGQLSDEALADLFF